MKAVQVTAYGGPEVLALTDIDRPEPGKGEVRVKVAYAGVNYIDGSIRCGKRRGTVCNFGAASGAVIAADPLELAEAGSVFFTRPHMADYMRDADEIGWSGGQMMDHAAAGRISINVDRVLPLEQAAEAHRILESRATTGKLLLNTP